MFVVYSGTKNGGKPLSHTWLTRRCRQGVRDRQDVASDLRRRSHARLHSFIPYSTLNTPPHRPSNFSSQDTFQLTATFDVLRGPPTPVRFTPLARPNMSNNAGYYDPPSGHQSTSGNARTQALQDVSIETDAAVGAIKTVGKAVGWLRWMRRATARRVHRVGCTQSPWGNRDDCCTAGASARRVASSLALFSTSVTSS